MFNFTFYVYHSTLLWYFAYYIALVIYGILGLEKEMTTPHIPHTLKIPQTVTTSTPTHPVTPNWSLFPGSGTDSPLSEIETTESPAQSIDQEGEVSLR